MSCAICRDPAIAGRLGCAEVCARCFNLYGARGRALVAETMCVAMDREIETDGRVKALREQIDALQKQVEQMWENSMMACWNCGATPED